MGFEDMNLIIKRTLLAFVTFTSTAILVGCATYYKPFGVAGGYKDRVIDDQTLHVEFHGNGYTSHDTVHKYFMYRCAELTQQHGFRYFTIVPPASSDNTPTTKSPVRSNGFDHSRMLKVHAVPIIIYSGGGGTIRYASDSADIRMFNEDTALKATVAGWDAAEVVERLGPFAHSNSRTPADVPEAWLFEPGHPKVRADARSPNEPPKGPVAGT
jgi:hypothetical protein